MNKTTHTTACTTALTTPYVVVIKKKPRIPRQKSHVYMRAHAHTRAHMHVRVCGNLPW